MKTGLVLLASYFILVPAFILALVFFQLSLHRQANFITKASAYTREEGTGIVTQIPAEAGIKDISLDARILALEDFFAKYRSPLTTYAEEIVKSADKYGLDFRLLPAIAMQESTLCRKAPKNSNNCWGFGIYGGKITRFDNFSQAIDVISRAIARDYHNQGLLNPEEIMTKYTPSNSGIWAENVSYIMGTISASL